MHQSRIQSEVEANPSHPTRNRILSSTLSSLLDARKTASSRAELERIANEYGVDIAKLESLARFVNTPSIDEGSRKKTVDDEGAELVTSEVRTLQYFKSLSFMIAFRPYGKNGLRDD